jgi:WD40 repeat protein
MSSEISISVNKFKTKQLFELQGHTETVEFAKFSYDGRYLVTGGMNNLLRVWDVDAGFSLKQTIDSIPQEDLAFVDWHPKAPLLLTGGKDYMVWLVNALNGKIMASLAGHDSDVTFALFTQHD